MQDLVGIVRKKMKCPRFDTSTISESRANKRRRHWQIGNTIPAGTPHSISKIAHRLRSDCARSNWRERKSRRPNSAKNPNKDDRFFQGEHNDFKSADDRCRSIGTAPGNAGLFEVGY